MKINLFDDQAATRLRPLTFTRPAGELRVGILTIAEKWSRHLNAEARSCAADYKQVKYSGWEHQCDLWINGRCFPTKELAEVIKGIAIHQGVRTANNQVIATHHNPETTSTEIQWIEVEADWLNYPEDIFVWNQRELDRDFELITAGRTGAKLSESNRVTGPGKIFIEEGARVEAAVLNPDGGYIYVGSDAEIMEGSLVKGSLALCEHATLKLGAKIYGCTTIGPHSKVGGEVSNSVIQGYSNKGHDGFLGNSVLGEWCNLGADTNTSNLKNNYAEVKLWDYETNRFRNTNLQFCGLIMGDHAKCGINTMFNTGTVVGVGSNIFGSGFPRNFIPSFAWGGNGGFTTYQLEKVFETADLVMHRRGLKLLESDKLILEEVFKLTQPYRNWENQSTSKV